MSGINITKDKRIIVKCTACNSCVVSCHKKALTLRQNQEGFFYPVINEDLCNECKACISVCPVIKKSVHNTLVKKLIFTGYSRSDYMRQSGSSGGIFPELAQHIIRNNGVVYGVKFDSNEQRMVYAGTNSVSVETLYKSKYVEAYDPDTFLSVKEQLLAGRKVLYCGTPCKIDGLKRFLGKEYPTLFTIDFMCHGKPSSRFLSEVICEEEKKLPTGKCVNVTFREKKKGWRNQTHVFYDAEGNELVYDSANYYYYFYFLHNYSIRRSCVKCSYYKNHLSDITLADYWSVSCKKDDDKGYSLVVVNTEKGYELLQKIQGKITLEEDINALSNIGIYAHSKRKGYYTKKREIFYEEYRQKGIEYIKGEGFKRFIGLDEKYASITAKLIRIAKQIKK